MALGGRDVRGLIGHVYAVSNRQDQARKILAQLKDEGTRSYVSPYLIAGVHAGLGEKDQALVWLEKASGEQDIGLRALNRDPTFDSLHSDPRFIDLLRRFRLARATVDAARAPRRRLRRGMSEEPAPPDVPED